VPRVTAGKTVVQDKLFFTYSSNVGATTPEQIFRIEYILNRNVSLRGEYDESGADRRRREVPVRVPMRRGGYGGREREAKPSDRFSTDAQALRRGPVLHGSVRLIPVLATPISTLIGTDSLQDPFHALLDQPVFITGISPRQGPRRSIHHAPEGSCLGSEILLPRSAGEYGSLPA